MRWVSQGLTSSCEPWITGFHGTNPLVAVYRAGLECPEITMKLGKIILAGAMLALIPSVTLAQQSLKGTVTTIDRPSETIAIERTQSGTVGAIGGATEQQFKAPEGVLDTVQAGDKVTFSASEIGGNKTITKIEPR